MFRNVILILKKLVGVRHKSWGKWAFWLVNFGLLCLYLWTLTESVPISVEVSNGRCLAKLSDRTAEIPCQNLSQGEISLFLERKQKPFFEDVGPIDFWAPRAGWHQILVHPGEGDERPIQITFTNNLKNWRKVLGEWRTSLESSALQWRAPIRNTYAIEASIRRPNNELAGILLLEPGGNSGWLFEVDTDSRQASWWRWKDDSPSEFLLGIPFQKSFLAQTQSLLRVILRSHHGALLLLLVFWPIKKFFKRWKPKPLLKRLPFGILILVIAVIILTVTTFIAVDVLERVPHVQDSVTLLFEAQLLARGHLTATPPKLPEFFEQEFLTVWNGRWFGQYPPGFPLILALGVLVKAPWFVNPLLSTLTIPLIYQLGLILFDRRTALIAAVLALFSPFYLLMSGSMMVHSAELFWTLLFLVSWVGWLEDNRSWRWLLVAGMALGMAFLTRQVTAVVVGGSVIGISLLSAATGHFGWQTSRANRRELFIGGTIVAFAFIPFFLLLFSYQWVVTGDPFQDPRLISRPFDRPGFGFDVGSVDNAFEYEEIDGEPIVTWYSDPDLPPRGHTPARGLFNTIQNLESLNDHLFGWLPFITLAFCWLVFLAGRPTFGDWLLLVLMGAVISVYISYWAAGIMYGPRYYYAAFPAFILLTSRGIFAFGAWFGGRAGHRLGIIITTLFIAGNLIFYLPGAIENGRGFNFVSGAPLVVIDSDIDVPAIVFITTDEDVWWQYGQFFSGNNPWLDGQIIYARNLGPENKKLADIYPDRTVYCWKQDQGLYKDRINDCNN